MSGHGAVASAPHINLDHGLMTGEGAVKVQVQDPEDPNKVREIAKRAMSALPELRKKAKELGIKGGHLMGIEKLKVLIADFEAPKLEESVEQVQDNIESNEK